jgi:hypothetical protein
MSDFRPALALFMFGLPAGLMVGYVIGSLLRWAF